MECYNSIGTEGGAEEAARARAHVRGLLEALGAELEEEGGDEAGAAGAADVQRQVGALTRGITILPASFYVCAPR